MLTISLETDTFSPANFSQGVVVILLAIDSAVAGCLVLLQVRAIFYYASNQQPSNDSEFGAQEPPKRELHDEQGDDAELGGCD